MRVVASIYRDFGNRNDRKQARLKYLVDKMGVAPFIEEFKKRCDFEVMPWRTIPDVTNEDWLGLHPQGDGKWFYGVFVENGRIADTEQMKMRTAFLEIADKLGVDMTVTAQQSLLFHGLSEEQIPALESILKQHGVPLLNEISNTRRYSMACPAMPTCGLAVAESERVAPNLITEIEEKIDQLGLASEQFTIRMTGCPNGCARPYTADIAFVGRRPGVYHVFVGGRLAGDRMADLYAADVKIEDVVDTLAPLLAQFAAAKQPGECLGDFYQRIMDSSSHRRRITGKEDSTIEQLQQKLVQIQIS